MLCTHMGAFHAKLFRLGKTHMSSQAEFDLLQPYLMPPIVGDDDADIWNHMHNINGNNANNNNHATLPRMTNKIFFLDLRQLSDANRTRSKQLRLDLQQSLGLKHDLSPVFRARPFKQLEFMPEYANTSSKAYKIASICDTDKYLPLQTELLAMAKAASVWLRTYFLTSPDVVVSSPEYLDQLLETWMENPCLVDG